MIPALFFVGPTKTGTTAIWHALAAADLLADKWNKEPFYFDRYYDGDREKYMRRYFTGRPHVIEVSPSYFTSPEVPSRIRAMFPQAKCVLTLREPVARTISMYGHMLRYGRFGNVGFAEALETLPNLLTGTRYRDGCARWIDAFGANDVLVLRQDAQGGFPDAIFPALAQFSDIPELAHAIIPERRSNQAVCTRSPRLSRLAAGANGVLRRYGASRLIECAKRLGCQRLLYSTDPKRRRTVGEADVQLLRARIAEEIAFFERLSGDVVSGRQVAELLSPSGLRTVGKRQQDACSSSEALQEPRGSSTNPRPDIAASCRLSAGRSSYRVRLLPASCGAKRVSAQSGQPLTIYARLCS